MTTVVVYDSILFGVGHNVRRWAEALDRRYTQNAIAFAPVNKRANKSNWYPEYPPGSLKANIKGSVDRIAPKHLQMVIHVDVPYAIYVIEGTDEIFPDSAPMLRLPFNAGFTKFKEHHAAWGRPTYHKFVKGQKKNNFLLRAHEATALRHPSIRGNTGAVFREW